MTVDISKQLTPREIVNELDQYIIGQGDAKKAVAIALRNRWRRQQVDPALRDEIAPKNIIMIGPTGVGKTEIARRLANLANSPFIKVEASKFTEVGYVGRDVESIIRDLTELAVNMVRHEEEKNVRIKAEKIAEERLLDLLLPPGRQEGNKQDIDIKEPEEKPGVNTREKLRKLLREGKFDDRDLDLEVPAANFPMVEIFSNAGVEDIGFNLKEMFGQMMPSKTKRRKVKLPQARELIIHEESQKLIDPDLVAKLAVELVQHSGMVFLDEVDKIASRNSSSSGPDISREGVQRDLLPIVEGSTVNTKYGLVKTDHILFVAAGAFHMNKPSDLLPELQGRFPIRVELDALKKGDFVRILVEPQNALIKQYSALMATEGISLEFTDGAIEEIASLAAKVNEKTEDIGARRLHTIMERLLEDLSFLAPEIDREKEIIDREYVNKKLSDLVQDDNLSRYIL